MIIEGKVLASLRWMMKLIYGRKNFIAYFDRHYSETHPVNHDNWTQLLQQFVNDNGQVNYRGFLSGINGLEDYLKILSKNPPNKNNWTKEDQLAYWINLYNASTVKLILDHYPVKSIREIKSGIQIPFFNSAFDIKFISAGDLKLSLNDVEHAILRLYDEPRIHFAINCASGSCPVLKNEAYQGTNLDEQLGNSTKKFLADDSKNQLNNASPRLSRIFQWYLDDFGGKDGLRKKLKDWTGKDISDDEIGYRKYDWQLNENGKGNAQETEKEN